MPRILMFAGALLWVGSMAVLAQRQRVLARRLARLERAALRRKRRPPAHVTVAAVNGAGRSLGPTPAPVTWRHPVALPARRAPTVQQLARLAVPLQRAGG